MRLRMGELVLGRVELLLEALARGAAGHHGGAQTAPAQANANSTRLYPVMQPRLNTRNPWL